MSIGKTRGFLYSLARLLGDVNAVQSVPKGRPYSVDKRAVGGCPPSNFPRK